MKRDLTQFIKDNYEKAIDYHYLQPYYQPVIRTSSRQLCSFEVLARWIDPEIGMVYPDEFIPVMEDIGAIHLLDEHIIRMACARLGVILAKDEPAVPISVNLSRKDFDLCDIFSVVDDIVSENRLPHDYINIEITESIMAENKDMMLEEISRFRENGYPVWMDDFGSAYSSLNVLKEFEFDELKLDMAFLRPFTQRSQRIATSIIDMAKSVNTHTLAEGVETEEQFRYLRNIGCEKVQGYYFGKPMPYEDAMRHIAEQGIGIESPQDRKYYDDIGKVNYLSAVPFMTREERDEITTARQLNSIPLSIIEVKGDSFSVLFYNTAFEETALETGLFDDVFSQELLCVSQPFNKLSAKLHRLLDSVAGGGDGSMLFTSHEEYYEVRVRCVARTRGKYSVLMRLSNLSKAAKAASTSQLDESLVRIYAMFERITLVDLNTDTIRPLYTTTREKLVSQNTDADKMAHEYAEKYLFPEDRDIYLSMVDPKTVEERFRENGITYMTRVLRTKSTHGSYEWKEYTDLRIGNNVYLILIKNVHQSVISLESRIHRTLAGEDGYTADLLWSNLIRSGLIRLFWKDRERRFLGASNAFLDYYGFDSVDEIFGSNDEDLGWHLDPGPYKSDELRVIKEGITTHNIPGNCLCDGENREILASKTPIYNTNGEIIGLMGYFIDRDLLDVNDQRGRETRRRDIHTGLLNSRGFSEEASNFRDEFYLRGKDFVRMHVSIDDFDTINERYGYDFGDKLLGEFGRALKTAFGRSCAVGRIAGSRFALMKGIDRIEDADILREQVRHAAARITSIDEIPVTIYSSAGYALFSESENLSEQEKMAERRILADRNKGVTNEILMSRAAELFHFFDDIPAVFAVYHVTRNEDHGTTDAVLFYVNHAYEKATREKSQDILGHGVRELYSFIDENWYDKMVAAALKGETASDDFEFEPTGRKYRFTANPIIYEGYCAVTYLEKD
ncbi:MAG: EAL domain-containing protein [Clostridiales bacterium]|nr:EAL domain-containing protein [Clostridiales bacterium]